MIVVVQVYTHRPQAAFRFPTPLLWVISSMAVELRMVPEYILTVFLISVFSLNHRRY